MSNIFNVKGLYNHIGTLYKAYMQFEGSSKKDVQRLRDIAANLELCNIVRDKDCIAVAGMQGTGKTTLIKNFYSFPDGILKTSVERGEAVPVFITESDRIAEGSLDAIRKYIDDNGVIREEKINIDDLAKESSKRGDTVCVELFTARKYFSKDNSSFILLPGFEKSTREAFDKDYNRLMRVCLNFSRAILLAVDEQNLANEDINKVLEVVLESGFNNNNSVFAITKCDDKTRSDSVKNEVKESLINVLKEHNFNVNPGNIICTGIFDTSEENDLWINELTDALNRSERPVYYEQSLKYYEPIVEEINEITDSLTDGITDAINKLEYLDKTSPLHELLIKQKEKNLKELKYTLSDISDRSYNIIEKQIKSSFEKIDPKILKEKKYLIFKKSLEEKNRDDEYVQKTINGCFYENADKNNDPVFFNCLSEGFNSKSKGLLLLPQSKETEGDLVAKEKKEKDNAIWNYFLNSEELALHVDNNNRELSPDYEEISETISKALTTFFIGNVVKGDYNPDVKPGAVSKLANDLVKKDKSNAAKKTGLFSAATFGLDMLDGSPELMNAVVALCNTPAAPYVAAAVAISAVAAGGIIVRNKNITVQASGQEAAKRLARDSLSRQCENLLHIYENGFDNMIDYVEKVHRKRRKIGNKQANLLNADQALTDIKFLCQDYYDGISGKITGE